MRIEDYTDTDETILWKGQPATGFIFRKTDFFLIPFSLVWGSIAIPIGAMTISSIIINISDTPFPEIALAIPFLLFGSLFFFVGIYITVGRFLIDIITRNRTAYALTNKRALIFGGLISCDLKSMPLSEHLDIQISGLKTGSIEFGSSNSIGRKYNKWNGPAHPFTFEKISDAQHVYELVRKIQQNKINNRYQRIPT